MRRDLYRLLALHSAHTIYCHRTRAGVIDCWCQGRGQGANVLPVSRPPDHPQRNTTRPMSTWVWSSGRRTGPPGPAQTGPPPQVASRLPGGRGGGSFRVLTGRPHPLKRGKAVNFSPSMPYGPEHICAKQAVSFREMYQWPLNNYEG
jgi:hypothetical protein